MRQILRLWWTFWGQGAGIVIGVAIILFIGFLAIPRGQAEVQTGIVIALNGSTSKMGARTRANIAIAGQKVWVELYARNDCAIGSPIVLQKVRKSVGQFYVAQERGCRAALTAR